MQVAAAAVNFSSNTISELICFWDHSSLLECRTKKKEELWEQHQHYIRQTFLNFWKATVLEFLLLKFQAGDLQFIKNETSTKVFSCEFWKIFQNMYFLEHLWGTASVLWVQFHLSLIDHHQVLVSLLQSFSNHNWMHGNRQLKKLPIPA